MSFWTSCGCSPVEENSSVMSLTQGNDVTFLQLVQETLETCGGQCVCVSWPGNGKLYRRWDVTTARRFLMGGRGRVTKHPCRGLLSSGSEITTPGT